MDTLPPQAIIHGGQIGSAAVVTAVASEVNTARICRHMQMTGANRMVVKLALTVKVRSLSWMLAAAV